MAQQEGLRRWGRRADGCKWAVITDEETEERIELRHEALSKLLVDKGQILTKRQWESLNIRGLRVGHYVRAGGVLYAPEEVGSEHTLSGAPAPDVGEAILVEIDHRRCGERDKARRKAVKQQRRAVAKRAVMREVWAGGEADDAGRWAVEALLQVRRPDVRRGRALELLVRWADDRGMAWSDSWISIAMVSRDLRDQAREMEKAIYPQMARQATGARADRRQNSARRQAHERAQQQWAARLRDRGRKRTRTESDGSV